MTCIPTCAVDVLDRAEIDALPGLLLLEFGVDWCPHCQGAQPAIEGALREHADLPHIPRQAVADADPAPRRSGSGACRAARCQRGNSGDVGDGDIVPQTAIKSHSTANLIGPLKTGKSHSTFKAGWLYPTLNCLMMFASSLAAF